MIDMDGFELTAFGFGEFVSSRRAGSIASSRAR